MGKKKDQKNLTIPQKILLLDEFKKPEHKKKKNPALARVAADLLGLETVPSKQSIGRWRADESKLREQAKGIVAISKHDRYRKQFEVKYLQSPETLEFCDLLFDHYLSIFSYKCLSYSIMVDEAREFARDRFQNLKIFGA